MGTLGFYEKELAGTRQTPTSVPKLTAMVASYCMVVVPMFLDLAHTIEAREDLISPLCGLLFALIFAAGIVALMFRNPMDLRAIDVVDDVIAVAMGLVVLFGPYGFVGGAVAFLLTDGILAMFEGFTFLMCKMVGSNG